MKGMFNKFFDVEIVLLQNQNKQTNSKEQPRKAMIVIVMYSESGGIASFFNCSSFSCEPWANYVFRNEIFLFSYRIDH